jgi:hypothetical protein
MSGNFLRGIIAADKWLPVEKTVFSDTVLFPFFRGIGDVQCFSTKANINVVLQMCKGFLRCAVLFSATFLQRVDKEAQFL